MEFTQLTTPAATLAPIAPRFSIRKSPAKTRAIAYRVEFARAVGGVASGLFLSQLFYWCQTMSAKNGAGWDGWIYKSAAEWETETGLTVRELATARKRCRELGLISELRAGVCGTVHYFLHLDKLRERVSFFTDCVISDAPKRQTETPQAPIRFSENANHIKEAETKKEISHSQQNTVAAAENSFPVPDPQTETHPVERALIACGVSKTAAAAICDAHSIPAIEQQLEWLDSRKLKSRAATIVAAIRGNWDAPGRAVTPTPATAQNGGAYAAYSDKAPDKTNCQGFLDSSKTPDKTPDILERQARVQADIAECLARMDFARRESFSAALDSIPTLRGRVEYLERAAAEWFDMQREKSRSH